jgi:Bacterial transcriptional regulator
LLIDDQRQRARVVDRPTAGQSTDIWDVARPIMNDLSKRLQESCFAAVLDQDSVIYVARATSNQRVSVGISISSRLPAHCVSTGRVLLAALPQDLLHKYLEAMTLTKFTPNTLTSKGPIARRLRRGALARLVDRGSGVGSPGFARFRRRSGAARARSSLLIETLTHSSLRFAVSLPGCPLASRDRRPPPSADSGDTRARADGRPYASVEVLTDLELARPAWGEISAHARASPYVAPSSCPTAGSPPFAGMTQVGWSAEAVARDDGERGRQPN